MRAEELLGSARDFTGGHKRRALQLRLHSQPHHLCIRAPEAKETSARKPWGELGAATRVAPHRGTVASGACSPCRESAHTSLAT